MGVRHSLPCSACVAAHTLLENYYPDFTMPPRRRRQPLQPTTDVPADRPSPPPSTQMSAPVSTPVTRQPAKRRMIADNAKEISEMKGQLNIMSELLHTISDRMTSDVAPTTPAVHAMPARETDPSLLSQPFPQQRLPDRMTGPPPTPAYQPYKARHLSTGQFPTTSAPTNTWMNQARRQDQVDPLSSQSERHQFREPPTPVYDSDDNDDLQTRVAHLLTSHLAPIGSTQGKKQFAHFYVRRGTKRVRTSLGELTIPEYNFGFMSLIDSQDTFDHDKPHMFRHLANINEDASHYEWSGVRFWSEEVCARIAGGKLSWDDEYRIDLLRLKFSQQSRLSTMSKDTHHNEQYRDKGIDVQTELPPEVRAAKPGPPCRAFNSGTCSYSHHHVYSGYGRLHICSHCVARKCLLLPHSNDKCKSKVFTSSAKPNKPKEELGFGK